MPVSDACPLRCRTAKAAGCGTWRATISGRARGIAVNTLGHNHPKLVPALQDQAAKLIHSSNYYHVPLQEQLRGLAGGLGPEQCLLLQQRAGANEAALKIARKFGTTRASTNLR